MLKLGISQHDGILCSNLPSFQGSCDGIIRNLPQPLFVEYVNNTVKKLMLSAVAGDGQKEKMALQAAPALSLAMVT
ncbi:hypothetical protein ABKU55_04540 [Enterobacter hormaechei]|uniref:hypothetical protein n=1 Tax=Enterobacter cloacae complex TaxID=354276 RepID=UPI001010C50F|nr:MULTISPECIES: hypothetical protein [Enterobacter cloacae complex]ELC6400563.1 hypothetical protein [Enterobacter hormaechei]ELJ9646307.1 hypothetical protein [Enterobacter hormaechei]MBU0249169.1 hypothetical protein [Enterobacter hormaechei]MCE1518428.1 hypothetical protein [Enterobacter hormaechei]MCM7758997.1 hypothetical protein [Enterobacter hormaechei]